MQIAVLSGKGGTGKTTVAASLAYLSPGSIKVDCDVDAPNLNIILNGIDLDKKSFRGSKIASIDTEKCSGCGVCEKVCRYGAISEGIVDELKCEGCAACTIACGQGAIALADVVTAETFITDTRSGILSRAEMRIGAEGSGRLVTELRRNAAGYIGKDSVVILDGSPGIGCAVMASVTGCDAALLVVEPTITGVEDFLRILSVCEFLRVKAFVCINKYDINPKKAREIEALCRTNKISVIGRVPYDEAVKDAIHERKPVVFFSESPAAKEITSLWKALMNGLKEEIE